MSIVSVEFLDLSLELNKWPKIVCCCFYGFIFSNFLRWNLPKFPQHMASNGKRILYTKNVGVVSRGKFTKRKKNWPYKFPWKTTKIKKYMERKFKCCQFCFLCSFWRHKNRKKWRFSFFVIPDIPKMLHIW